MSTTTTAPTYRETTPTMTAPAGSANYHYAGREGDDALSAWLADHEPPPLAREDREAIARLITPRGFTA